MAVSYPHNRYKMTLILAYTILTVLALGWIFNAIVHPGAVDYLWLKDDGTSNSFPPSVQFESGKWAKVETVTREIDGVIWHMYVKVR